MSSERPQRTEKLYHAALELEPRQRDAFLNEACKGDEDLRRKVSTLLAENALTGNVLDRPPWEGVSSSGLNEAATRTTLPEGMDLGPYRIQARLGAGGMGEVYRAVDTRLDRNVAIKIVSQEFSALFGREARAISALNHPRICTLYDIGPDFLVMELIEGQTLASRIRQGPLPLDEVLRYGAQIAEALAEAHAHGIIHRDLKPGNVMVRGNSVKVLDFGLAKFTQAPDGELTAANIAMGTPAYMAPEQVHGKELNSGTDLFALGLVLYEMAAGKLPFPGASLGRMLASGTEVSIDVPCKVRSRTASRLNTLILGLLEKDPARRPQSAAAVRQQLFELAQPRHTRTMVAALTGVLVLAAVALWWFHASQTPPPRWPKPTSVSMITADSGEETTPAASPDGAWVAFSWTQPGSTGNIYVTRADGQGQPRPLTHAPTDNVDLSPAWSPDQRYIAFVRRRRGTANGKILVIPAQGGPERELRDVRFIRRGLANGLAWTPDSQKIVFAAQSPESGASTLFLMGLMDGNIRSLLTPPEGVIGDDAPAISPDGRYLAFVRWSSPSTSTLLVQRMDEQDQAAGEPVMVSTMPGQAPHSPAWADNKRLLFLEGERILEWEDGANIEQIYLSSERLSGLSIVHRDRGGAPAVIAAQRNAPGSRIWTIPLRTAGQAAGAPELLSSFGSNSNNPDYSPDGKHVVFVSRRSGAPELWIIDPDGSNLRQLTRLDAESLGVPKWSSDNRQVAFFARLSDEPQIYVIDAAQSEPVPRQITHSNPGCNIPTWSRDGMFIYCSRRLRGDEFRLYRVPAGGEAGDTQMERWFIGKSATETGDKLLYVRDDRPGLFTVSLAGDPSTNPEERLVDDIMGPIAYFVPVKEGVYYTGQTSGNYSALRFFDYAQRKTVDVASGAQTGHVNSLTITPDGRNLVYTQVPRGETDLTLIEFQR